MSIVALLYQVFYLNLFLYHFSEKQSRTPLVRRVCIWSTKSQQTDAGWFGGNGKSFRSISLGFLNKQPVEGGRGKVEGRGHLLPIDPCDDIIWLEHGFVMLSPHRFKYTLFLFYFFIVLSTPFTRRQPGVERGRGLEGYWQVASVGELIKKEQELHMLQFLVFLYISFIFMFFSTQFTRGRGWGGYRQVATVWELIKKEQDQ